MWEEDPDEIPPWVDGIGCLIILIVSAAVSIGVLYWLSQYIVQLWPF